ncbi:unnamed protein product [Lampetra planeri]
MRKVKDAVSRHMGSVRSGIVYRRHDSSGSCKQGPRFSKENEKDNNDVPRPLHDTSALGKPHLVLKSMCHTLKDFLEEL